MSSHNQNSSDTNTKYDYVVPRSATSLQCYVLVARVVAELISLNGKFDNIESYRVAFVCVEQRVLKPPSISSYLKGWP